MENKRFAEQDENAKQSWQIGGTVEKTNTIEQEQSRTLRLCRRHQVPKDRLGNNLHSSSSAEEDRGMTAQREWAWSCCSEKWKCYNEVYKQKYCLWQTGNNNSLVIYAVKTSFGLSHVQFGHYSSGRLSLLQKVQRRAMAMVQKRFQVGKAELSKTEKNIDKICLYWSVKARKT